MKSVGKVGSEWLYAESMYYIVALMDPANFWKPGLGAPPEDSPDAGGTRTRRLNALGYIQSPAAKTKPASGL